MAEVKIVISIVVSGGGDNSPAVSVHVLEGKDMQNLNFMANKFGSFIISSFLYNYILIVLAGRTRVSRMRGIISCD